MFDVRWAAHSKPWQSCGLDNDLEGGELLDIQTLRTTLLRWRREALAYFLCRATNARIDGFNGKGKLKGPRL